MNKFLKNPDSISVEELINELVQLIASGEDRECKFTVHGDEKALECNITLFNEGMENSIGMAYGVNETEISINLDIVKKDDEASIRELITIMLCHWLGKNYFNYPAKIFSDFSTAYIVYSKTPKSKGMMVFLKDVKDDVKEKAKFVVDHLHKFSFKEVA